ncbi:MAG: 7-cyano-7-deazaguanine synthase QueC [Candidatus Aminicenantes bacterium]|nr:7-cyano-7-deazaguanine synthase QueC [Candidatus Aminicenantes bacterium]
MKSCIVLFSGGIDSTTALYWAINQAEKVFPLTFDYGQRHRIEIEMSGRQLKRLNLPQKLIKVDLSQIGGSSLTDEKIPVPEYTTLSEIGRGLPSTYVPFRNGIFFALAAGWAERMNIHHLVCGFNVIDSPEYPDTRKSFVEAMEEAVNQGTHIKRKGRRLKIHAPFVDKKKSEIIRIGLSLRADYSYSVSCYRGQEIPCGTCSSCLLREKAWAEAGEEDHLLRRLHKEGRL